MLSDGTRIAIAEQITSGKLDLKYAYTGQEGAARHLAHSKSSGYESLRFCSDMQLEAFVPVLPSHVTDLCLFDFGSGTGVATSNIATALVQSGASLKQIVLLDFSRELLHVASDYIARHNRGIAVHSEVYDFEMGDKKSLKSIMSIGDKKRRVYLIIGGTLGNLREPHQACRNINQASCVGDVFIVSVQLRDETMPNEVELRDYNSQNFLSGIISPVKALEIDTSQLAVSTHYCVSDNRYVSVAEFTKYSETVIGSQTFAFPAGHRFEAFTSRRFSEAEALSIVRMGGWDITSSYRFNSQLWITATSSKPQTL